MKAVRGKAFNGQRIVLDGKSFIECHFKDSTLIIEGTGLFEMQNCKIEEDCRLAVEGPGQVLLHQLKMMLYSGGWMSRVVVCVNPPESRTVSVMRYQTLGETSPVVGIVNEPLVTPVIGPGTASVSAMRRF